MITTTTKYTHEKVLKDIRDREQFWSLRIRKPHDSNLLRKFIARSYQHIFLPFLQVLCSNVISSARPAPNSVSNITPHLDHITHCGLVFPLNPDYVLITHLLAFWLFLSPNGMQLLCGLSLFYSSLVPNICNRGYLVSPQEMCIK